MRFTKKFKIKTLNKISVYFFIIFDFTFSRLYPRNEDQLNGIVGRGIAVSYWNRSMTIIRSGRSQFLRVTDNEMRLSKYNLANYTFSRHGWIWCSWNTGWPIHKHIRKSRRSKTDVFFLSSWIGLLSLQIIWTCEYR